jgi:two-component system, NarL family, nitrate/nitrite response regulator NarL
MTLRVLVASDVGVVREILHTVLTRQDGVNVLNTIGLAHAKEEAARLHPDVVLFDATRPGSANFAKDLVAVAPRSKVVAFGVKETEEEILALAAAGTAGYIRDSAESGDIAKVLMRVMCDELTCSPRTAASLYRHVAVLSQNNSHPVTDDSGSANSQVCAVPLSRRELQIAHLIDGGLTNKEIGRQLGIEAATVKNHVHNLCEKLDVHRRGEATARIRAILRGSSAPHGIGTSHAGAISPADNASAAVKRGADNATPPRSAPASFPAPTEAKHQKPAARSGNHAGHPWTDIGQLGGVAIPSAPSDGKGPMAKL